MFKYAFLFTIPLALAVTSPALAVTSAELYRSTPEVFGKFEARVRFAGGDGVVSSFFLWKDGSELADAYWNELDFEKLGAACDLQTNSIYGMPETTHEGRGYALEALCTGYHTYAYAWTPDYIAWLVDGTEIHRDTGADAVAYAENAADGLQFRFNVWPGNASFGGNFSEGTLPVYQFVAWAQYSEYAPGAGDDGTDFKLTWREELDALPAGWQVGSWDSPFSLSTHSAENVVFVDGIAVIGLTADDATGYTGTPPPDVPGAVDVPSAAAGAASEVAEPSPGDAIISPIRGTRGDGCACRLGSTRPDRSGSLPAWLLASAACARRFGRKRGKA